MASFIRPFSAGLALAITVSAVYALCALVWSLAPGPSLGFMNNVFHGLDFTLMVRPQPFAWSWFFAVLLALSAWALGAGAFFAWVLRLLTR